MTGHLFDGLSRFIARIRSNQDLSYGILPGATADRVLLGTRPSASADLHGAGPIHGQPCAGTIPGAARRDTVLMRSTACDNRAIRLSRDASNCGRVGVECDPGEICLAGVCRPGRSRF